MTNGKSSIGSLHLLQPGGGGGGWQNTAKYFISPPPSAISKKKKNNNNNNNNNKVKPLLSGHLRDLNRGCLPSRSS